MISIIFRKGLAVLMHRIFFRTIVSGALFAMLAGVCTREAQAGSVNISGKVTHWDGTPFAGVKVDLKSDGSDVSPFFGAFSYHEVIYTDANGNWSINAFYYDPVPFIFSFLYNAAYYTVNYSADRTFFSNPGRLTVKPQSTGQMAPITGINSQQIGTFPQLGSQVIAETPGLNTWFRLGDGSYAREMISGRILGPGGLWLGGGKVATSFVFNGNQASSYLDIGLGSISGAWTLSFWANRTASTNVSAALLADGVSAIKIEQNPSTRKLGFTKFGVADYTFNYILPVGQWAHVTMTTDGAKTALYVNGVLQDTIAASIPLPRSVMGRRAAGVDILMGSYDEIAAWGRRLTDGEILNLYSRSDLGSISGRIATPTGVPLQNVPVVLGTPTFINSVDEIPHKIFTPAFHTNVALLDRNANYDNWWPGGTNQGVAAIYKGQIVVSGSSYSTAQSIFLRSDDGSRLYLDGGLLINNDGNHGDITVSANTALSLSGHDLEVRAFEGSAPWSLYLDWQGTVGSVFSRELLKPWTQWDATYYNLARLAVVYTDANGNYTFNNIPSGVDWLVHAEFPNFVFSPVSRVQRAGDTGADFPLIASPPTISDIPNQVMDEDGALSVGFTVFDYNTPLADLKLSATTSDGVVLPTSGISFGGAAGSRSVTIRPRANAFGTNITVQVTVTDSAGQTASDTFQVTVRSVNDAPVAGSPYAVDFSAADARGLVSSIGGLPTGNTAHTIEAWVKLKTPTTARQWLLNLGQYGTYSHHWLFNPGSAPNKMKMQFGVWGKDAITDPEIETDKWTHLATTYDPTTTNYTVYVNGVALRQKTLAVPFFFTNTTLSLATPTGTETTFHGAVDELRVWNRVLSAPEIQQIYGTRLVGNEVGLQLYCRFDEGGGDVAADSAFTSPGNGGRTDGTLTGAYAYVPGVFADTSYRTNLVNEDTTTPIFLSGYDVEDWTSLSFQVLTQPVHGSLNRLAGGWNPTSANPVLYTPAANYNGPDTFTYQLKDTNGALSSIETVYLQVTGVNDLPILSDIAPIVIEEDSTSPRIPFQVYDAETPADQISLYASALNTGLIPATPASLVFGGSGTNRTIQITPAAGELGQTTVQIQAVDGNNGFKSISFAVKVVPKPAYAVYDLGVVNFKQESYGRAISDKGWVAGSSDTPALPGAAALLYRGFETEENAVYLGTLGGAVAQANGINAAGVITGVSATGTGTRRAFRWADSGSGGAMSVLPDISLTAESSGRSVNASGMIAGYALLTSGQYAAVLWSNSVAYNLGTLGGTNSEAFGLNDTGWVAGYAQTNGNVDRAAIYTSNRWVFVGVNNEASSRAMALNNLGHAVGYSYRRADPAYKPFIRDNQGSRELPLIAGALKGQAKGINDFGQVIGQAGLSGDKQKAFLYSASKLYDLNELLTEDSGWTLTDATAINRDGWITGIGTSPGGQVRAFLAVPAWVVGRQIPRPEGAYPRLPQMQLLGDRGANTEGNSFVWSDHEQKVFVVRPVKARLSWFTSDSDVITVGTNVLANTNRIAVAGAAIWPRIPTRHVAGAPVEVEPQGVPFGYSFQNVEYLAGSGGAVEPNTKVFRATSPGYTVLRYLDLGSDGIADPLSDNLVFDVVRTHLYTNSVVYAQTDWVVGETIRDSSHYDYLGKNGFVLFEKALYDGSGLDRAYDRVSRRGSIIPVNALTPTTSQAPYNYSPLVVAWYQTNRLGVAWANRAVQYNAGWPQDTTNKIIIAQTTGTGGLPDNLYKDLRVYVQADTNLPGFNPNEEHALLIPGDSGQSLYALRNDLNGQIDSPPRFSAPFALLKYRDAATDLWKIRPYKVVAEEDPYFFKYAGEAGKEIQPPLPLSGLPLCLESRAVSGPWWEDYQGKIYARAAGADGENVNVVIQWFYKLQPGFWYDVDANGTNDVVDGTSVAWLDRLPGGTVGTPVNVTYDIRWPDQDNVLQIGQTLLKSAQSSISGNLPEIKNQARAELVFDSLNVGDTNYGATLARLYDPLTPRVIKTGVVIPDSIARQNIGGKEYFSELPWALKSRLTYDPVNKWLSFAGYLDEEFDVGQPLMLPNVLSSRERDRIKKLAESNTDWKSLVDKLYTLTRNPNQINQPPLYNPDDLILGLAYQYVVKSNFTVSVLNVQLSLSVTNYLNTLPSPLPASLTVLRTNVVPEAFGDQPKALTAALSGVPPASPKPGSALRFDGSSGYLQTSTAFDLSSKSFTIELWAKRSTPFGTNMLVAMRDGASLGSRLSVGFMADGSFRFGFGGTALQASPSLSDTEWHHWACVFNAVTSSREIYRDGVLANSDVAPGLYNGSGSMVVGAQPGTGAGVRDFFKGDIDEIRLWTAARSGYQINLNKNKRLKGVESDLFISYRFDEVGTSVADSSRHGLDSTLYGGASRVASTAPCGIPPRYVTVAFNNDPKLPGLPVGLNIIRIDDGPYLGDLKALPGDNVFDQRMTFRHSSEFGGNPDGIQFQWYYKFDTANFDPTSLPLAQAGSSEVNLNGWIQYSGFQPPTGQGVNDVTIGEGGEAGLLIMSDTWWVCRYRGYNINLHTTNEWSGWVGDPASSPDQPRAKLAEGWIKRVLRGLNLFDQRVADFHSSPVATYVSMIQQAGPRYTGDIAFNPGADNLNSLGLIQAYETVLRRGRSLSIDGVPQVNFDPANNALLLAAGRIADLYMLVGNEAYGDAQDPTVGFGSSSTEYGTLSSSIFAFQNQVDSLLEEELTLLRGRDDSRSGVASFPVYNRLLWNFTLGEGEVAYKQVYNIKDLTGAQDSAGRDVPDGFINEKDARKLFPQGHGDAWGHYLTALKEYYSLLRHPQFTWVPRTENVSVAGQAIEVDYMDERKFARAAAALAKTGKEIVDLTYRLSYTEDPNGQWQGYKDTVQDRSWGVDEWARRAGMASYFSWLTANAILPDSDPNPNHSGLEKVDRQTVEEITEITSQMNEVQAKLDMSDVGLNPLGLVKGAMVFDIDPTFNAVGSTAQIGRAAVQGLGHFDQIKERAIKSLNNAARVWDEANNSSRQLRQQQDALDDFQRTYRSQENDYKSRMIEIFGYPYAGDIGAGKLYPSGYDGPDLYHYMYVDTTELTGENSPASTTFTGFFTSPNKSAGLDTNDFFLGFVSNPSSLDPSTNGIMPVSFHMSAGDYGFLATTAMAKRRAQGELQFALSDLVQANAQLKISAQNYDGVIQDVKSDIALLEANYNVNANKLKFLTKQKGEIVGRNVGIAIFKAVQLTMGHLSETTWKCGDAIAEAVPKVVGLATDALSVPRSTIKITAGAIAKAIEITSDVADLSQTALELSKEEITLQTEIDVTTEDQRFEILQRTKELESRVRNEAALRLELFNQQEVVRQAAQKYLTKLAEGQRLMEELVRYRRDIASQITEQRYQDMTFRIFRNDAIQKYRAQFDLAARYCYLAASVYDYETSFLGSDPRAGRRYLNSLIKQRAIGQIVDGNPVVGPPGLADSVARLEASFEVIRGQFGINNPQLESGAFHLRPELFRIHSRVQPDLGPDGIANTPEELAAVAEADAANAISDDSWHQQLRKAYVPNLWNVPEFRRYCRPFAPESAGAQPGLVLRFSSTITFGLNHFGWPLSGGDSAYDPTYYSTKINAVGVQFDGYDAAALSVTPRVYLIPVGMDVLRSPTGNTLATRQWRIFDQALPIPFPIGDSDIGAAGFLPINDTLSGAYGEVRRFSSMRAYPTEAFADLDTATIAANTRLVGRSAWNTEWLLIIPGGTLLFDPNKGIDSFINSVSDIRLLIMSYSYAGN